MKLTKAELSRFFSKINKNGPKHPVLGTRCHIWLGGLRTGYGDFWLHDKQVLAHRLAWLIVHGRWPSPNALHKCDNRTCVRIEHLFEGNQQENIRDKMAKGREIRGQAVITAKLTDAQVKEILEKYGTGKFTQAKLALQYKVGQAHISSIVRRRAWKHLDERLAG